MSKKQKDELLWTVTYHKDSGVQIKVGPGLEKYDSGTNLQVIAQHMVTIGTRLIGASLNDDDDWGGDDE